MREPRANSHNRRAQFIRSDARELRHLAVISGTKHDDLSLVATTELQPERLMTEPTATVEQPHEINPPIDRGMSIGKAAIISIASAAVVFISTYEVVKATLSAGMTRALAVVSLLSLVALAYGLIELALAVVATTAERRRKAREVTERRKGDRARRPTPT
ncbi:MAG TPA: hypothetical protein VF105_02025 [Gemmatimonadaceae bacterium]